MQKVKIKYNSNCQAYTAIISDKNGNVQGIGYGTSKPHAVKMARLEASGRINKEGLVARVSVAI